MPKKIKSKTVPPKKGPKKAPVTSLKKEEARIKKDAKQ